MAPPAWREREMMPEAMNQIDVPATMIIAHMMAMISELLTCSHVLVYLVLATGVLLMAPWRRRCTTWRLIDVTGHLMGWPVCKCPINYPLTQFYGVVKISLTKLAQARDSRGAVTALYGRLPTKNWILWSRKGCCSVLVTPL